MLLRFIPNCDKINNLSPLVRVEVKTSLLKVGLSSLLIECDDALRFMMQVSSLNASSVYGVV